MSRVSLKHPKYVRDANGENRNADHGGLNRKFKRHGKIEDDRVFSSLPYGIEGVKVRIAAFQIT